jgi:UDP-3-O-[3-hydroxymyristoyl] glucosamine N-acyltransferase
MVYKLSYIAQTIGVEFDGDDIEIDGINTLKDATSTELSFLSDSKYAKDLPDTKASAVIVPSEYASSLPSHIVALVSDEPYLKLALASKLFAPKLSADTYQPTIGSGCDIASDVKCGRDVTIGNNVTIMSGCYIGDGVTIGDNTFINPNVTIYHRCSIGSDCIIHSGTVIGCDGYGFAHTKLGEHIKLYQNGNVIIEDSVEIGANCSIDRAVFGSTIIQKGTKLDNLIQIAHNCNLGEHTLLAAQVGLAGSTTLGRNVVMGGQSATAGHLSIGDFATIAGKGGVTKNLEGGKTYAGFPAIEIKLWRRMQATLHKLIKKPNKT